MSAERNGRHDPPALAPRRRPGGSSSRHGRCLEGPTGRTLRVRPGLQEVIIRPVSEALKRADGGVEGIRTPDGEMISMDREGCVPAHTIVEVSGRHRAPLGEHSGFEPSWRSLISRTVLREVKRAPTVVAAQWHANQAPVLQTAGPRATACKAPRHRWHSRQAWHCGICNLQNLKSPVGFESHPLRHSATH